MSTLAADEFSLSITTAAVTAAGPISNYKRIVERPGPDGQVQQIEVPDPSLWQAAVAEQAANIAVMASEKGKVGKTLGRIRDCENKVNKSSVFMATVIGCRKEESSQRGVVTLYTGSTKEAKDVISGQVLPAGCEQIRTDRTDNDQFGMRMAQKASALVGHRVFVWKFVEAMEGRDGQGARILAHIEDLGIDRDAASKGMGQV